ncbi:hypothetical protein QAD02_004128 [Eretmocerus hayati]|uniref:Uncharacterized protein n=1 Tax=Eretmocerus hayati TaxID=131215 RepID=A0ACC2NPS3_9HYME|nr:hypothetical protein QAD02_004128 [Eretmocerus hayati]
MKKISPYFEKYITAPSPKRDYCGIKVFENEVVLYTWKISHGPHLLPVIRVVNNSAFNRDKTLQEEIRYIFGSKALNYINLLTSVGNKTLLTLPESIIKRLVRFLSFKDVYQLLCASSISNEVFSSNIVWETLFKRAKKSCKLTEMEKDLASKQGFKKLTKDHHIRNFTRKEIKVPKEIPRKQEPSITRSDKITRSASVDIPKISLPTSDRDTMKKQISTTNTREMHRPKKVSALESNTSEEKQCDVLKKTSSEGKTRLSFQSRNFMEKFAAGENVQNFKLSSEPLKKVLYEDEDRFRSQLDSIEKSLKSLDHHTRRDRRNSTVEPSDYFPAKLRDSRKPQNSLPKPVENNTIKRPTFTVGSLKTGSTDKTLRQKRESIVNSNSSVLKSSMIDDRDDDLDECGMSFLMRRYLETSNDVSKKFSETNPTTRLLKNSSIQVDMKETPSTKQTSSLKKIKTVDKPSSRMKTNGPVKSKTVKRK